MDRQMGINIFNLLVINLFYIKKLDFEIENYLCENVTFLLI